VQFSHLVQIVWSYNNLDSIKTEYIISVDGTHCRINEPRGEISTQWYSHKFHKAAVNYEVAIDLWKSKVVWINGPFPAATHDLTIYQKEEGLRSKVPVLKKVIADNGYQCQDDNNLSTPNKFDSEEVKEFNKRARARHETLNKRLKDFNVLKDSFGHELDKHKFVFEAVCVLVQYDMNNGLPLFDI
jgi:DDE superfamily endonuclease